ncbi:MAG: 50S ribosomal protein L21e [Candidatus Aenigmarchaeota archaeon CG_4_10_14_0_8_um_filter_37_24]|nr:50S ribosomal protein L21e [Candidatus Aenigmarchaeota archaeon]OIN88393.1 MAG: hypothetical protein AUJ50_01090 [Candidatus Aenigmarchaeota archaeon CG1_02_38_14]PIV68960.1 MAG: 50S ribosomal protein L21e [Candidatus Aenigmarchaeota archaeon CG01_land_8_20_14_3_00_37_9]PIW41139.1 MAG: 50S ribosomal protein L21e [Candidatus Aenigmarchaeota archaeon CG15_BIG_FIL_POST_REV_8_21_14_020_37_27]PIX50839.1 MAG: 50S ribosomal protein L21e [Candidatus Aenigmarchaeota archaeon CG_4_8_14_3_um_filter_37_
MTHKAKGVRSRTRTLLARRNKEKTSVNKILKEFEIGSKVVIKADSSIHQGRPYKRFYGRSGTIIDKKGRAYIVEIKDGNKRKEIIASSVHLKGT